MAEDHVEVFPEPDSTGKKKKKPKVQAGGFQTLGLSYSILKGVTRKGYKVPTPIQRRTLPLILNGQDVVAMARTGSGKTAAFLLPMLEKLKQHSAKIGARGLILSPTRELALQTFKFAKELGRFTDLRSVLILGGDNMEHQFSDMHTNPDIIVATPGRFLHLLVEMEIPLLSIEYVVFDEADRLFELGFEEQLREILLRLSPARQTVLFSATLPKILVNFAKAGLKEPTLVRLDVDTKLPEHLETQYFQVRREDKLAVLTYLLREVIPKDKMTVVFVATKHHIEFLKEYLTEANIPCTHTYGSLDQTARKINVAKFRAGKVKLLLVTDVAARGIDIPLLDYVINFDFPAAPKLYVHRVGRVARAGRSGTAFSLVSQDEMAYLIDLHVFLGRSFAAATGKSSIKEDGVFGAVPQTLIDEERDSVNNLVEGSVDLMNLKKVMTNAYKLYDRSRPQPAAESVKRAKQLEEIGFALHPVFRSILGREELYQEAVLKSLSKWKPSQTVFEVNKKPTDTVMKVMQAKRSQDDALVWNPAERRRELLEQSDWMKHGTVRAKADISALTSADADDITTAFNQIIAPGRNKEGILPPRDVTATSEGNGDASSSSSTKAKRKAKGKSKAAPLHGVKVDSSATQVFVPYRAENQHEDAGYSVQEGGNFARDAGKAVLDMTADDMNAMNANSQKKKWDRKKKKFVGESGNKKTIKTENGTRLPASFKADRYKEWAQKNRVGRTHVGEDEDSHETNRWKVDPRSRRRNWHTSVTEPKKRGNEKRKDGDDGEGSEAKVAKRGGEMRSKDQIMKERRRKERIQQHAAKKHRLKAKKAGGKKKR